VSILALTGDGTWDTTHAREFEDTTKTYYYAPLNGFKSLTKIDIKQLNEDLNACSIPGIARTIYGVRKSDIETIKSQKNWINIEDALVQFFATPIEQKAIVELVVTSLDLSYNKLYSSAVASMVKDEHSPYKVFVSKIHDHSARRGSISSIERLCEHYAKDSVHNPYTKIKEITDEFFAVNKRYPLLSCLPKHHEMTTALVQYINMIDSYTKGE
jgi:hypothetical protein